MVDGVKQGTIVGTVLVLLKSVVGGGMLGLPFAFQSCGYVLALILLAIICYVFEKTIFMLTTCAEFVAKNRISSDKDDLETTPLINDATAALASPPSLQKSAPLKTYEEVVQCLCGGNWGRYVQITKFLFAYGASVSFLQATSDFLNDVIAEKYEVDLNKAEIIWIFGSLVSLPVSMLPSMQLLKYTSGIAIGALLYVTCVIIFLAFTRNKDSDESGDNNDDDDLILPIGKVGMFNISLDTLRALPIFLFAFGCQFSVITLYNEMKIKSEFKIVAKVALFIGFLFYSVVGLTASADFGEDVESNVLNSYGQGITVTIARLSYGLALLLTYPIGAFMARETVWSIYNPTYATDLLKPGYTYPPRFYVISVLFFIAVVFPASVISNLSTIFGVTGATFGAAMYTGFPSFAYLKMLELIDMNQSYYVPADLPCGSFFAKVVLWATIILGVLATVVIMFQDLGVF